MSLSQAQRAAAPSYAAAIESLPDVDFNGRRRALLSDLLGALRSDLESGGPGADGVLVGGLSAVGAGGPDDRRASSDCAYALRYVAADRAEAVKRARSALQVAEAAEARARVAADFAEVSAWVSRVSSGMIPDDVDKSAAWVAALQDFRARAGVGVGLDRFAALLSLV
jgi:hypothetical protein